MSYDQQRQEVLYKLLLEELFRCCRENNIPIDLKKIDYAALKRDAEQLWAEAVYRYQYGQHVGTLHPILEENVGHAK
jgi:hypothetical protein